MSSSFYALCVSHTPAISISADLGRAEADHLTTRTRITGHDHCDIVIERVSGGPVELACPGRQLPGPTGCKGTHRDTEWIDVAWLRVLAAATTPPNRIDPALLHRVSVHGCWTPERIASLRGELGMPEPAPEPAVCPRCKGHGKVPDWSNFDQYHGEPKPKPCPNCTTTKEN